MANTLTGVADEVITQSMIKAFSKKLAPLSAFSTSFNADAAKPGDQVTLVIESYDTTNAAAKTTHTAYTVQDVTATTKNIALTQPVYVSWALDDVEFASSDVVNLEAWATSKANHLAKEILNATATGITGIWENITNANYTNQVAFTGAAATFAADDFFDIKNIADENHWPEDRRSVILKSDYVVNLLKDNAIQSNPNAGDQPLREGSVGRLAGFDVYQSEQIPTAGNMVGFACTPACMGVAMRYLAPQAGHTYDRAEPITDPQSGITLGLRQWYDNSTGRHIRVLESVFGANVGQSTGLYRIISA